MSRRPASLRFVLIASSVGGLLVLATPWVELAARHVLLRPTLRAMPFDRSGRRQLSAGVNEQLVRRHGGALPARVKVLRREHRPRLLTAARQVYSSDWIYGVWLAWVWAGLVLVLHRRQHGLPPVTPIGVLVALGVLAVGMSLVVG